MRNYAAPLLASAAPLLASALLARSLPPSAPAASGNHARGSSPAGSHSAESHLSGSHPAAHAKVRYARIRRACRQPKPGHSQCMALGRVTVAADTPEAKPFVQDDGATESGPAGGLTPAQLASAYEYDPAEGGAGQTIALID